MLPRGGEKEKEGGTRAARKGTYRLAIVFCLGGSISVRDSHIWWSFRSRSILAVRRCFPVLIRSLLEMHSLLPSQYCIVRGGNVLTLVGVKGDTHSLVTMRVSQSNTHRVANVSAVRHN